MVKKYALGDYIIEHYNQNHSIGLCERLARSLEPKWSIRKHDVAKFIINHSVVQTLPKSETLIKYTTYKVFNFINPSTHNIFILFLSTLLVVVMQSSLLGEMSNNTCKYTQTKCQHSMPSFKTTNINKVKMFNENSPTSLHANSITCPSVQK